MSRLPTPLELLYRWEKETPDKPWLYGYHHSGWQSVSWGGAVGQARRVANGLLSLGLKAGDRVGILSDNCPHWCMADAAIMIAGAVSVPLFTTMKTESVLYCIEHSGLDVILVGKSSNWEAVASAIPARIKLIAFPEVETTAKAPQCEAYNWDRFVEEHEPIVGEREHQADDLLTIIYTSGTTGVPKGVMHTYRSFAAMPAALNEAFACDENTRVLCYLPLAHIAERLFAWLLAGLASNGELYFNRSVETFGEDIKYCRPTIILSVPRLWTKFQMSVIEAFGEEHLQKRLADPATREQIKSEVREFLGFADTKTFITGSAPTALPLAQWLAQFDIVLCDLYGMTEGAPITIIQPGAQRLGTVGRAASGVELKLSDSGEIMFKGEIATPGYYNAPDITAETIVDGWVCTGDKGVVDSEGFVKLTGRVKEIYKTAKGKYVAPAPIEGKMAKSAYLEQLCLVGEGMLASVLLAVLSEEGRRASKSEVNEKLSSLMATVNEGLESHERFSHVVILDEPWTIENGLLTHTMKLKRSEIETSTSYLIDFLIENQLEPGVLYEADIPSLTEV